MIPHTFISHSGRKTETAPSPLGDAEPAPVAIPMTQTSGGRPSIDMRQARWPWWGNAIRVNPLHWCNAIMDDLKFTSFCPPFIADLEGESFEDASGGQPDADTFPDAAASLLHSPTDSAEAQA